MSKEDCVVRAHHRAAFLAIPCVELFSAVPVTDFSIRDVGKFSRVATVIDGFRLFRGLPHQVYYRSFPTVCLPRIRLEILQAAPKRGVDIRKGHSRRASELTLYVAFKIQEFRQIVYINAYSDYRPYQHLNFYEVRFTVSVTYQIALILGKH
jgi:hypothetical protein